MFRLRRWAFVPALVAASSYLLSLGPAQPASEDDPPTGLAAKTRPSGGRKPARCGWQGARGELGWALGNDAGVTARVP